MKTHRIESHSPSRASGGDWLCTCRVPTVPKVPSVSKVFSDSRCSRTIFAPHLRPSRPRPSEFFDRLDLLAWLQPLRPGR